MAEGSGPHKGVVGLARDAEIVAIAPDGALAFTNASRGALALAWPIEGETTKIAGDELVKVKVAGVGHALSSAKVAGEPWTSRIAGCGQVGNAPVGVSLIGKVNVSSVGAVPTMTDTTAVMPSATSPAVSPDVDDSAMGAIENELAPAVELMSAGTDPEVALSMKYEGFAPPRIAVHFALEAVKSSFAIPV